MYRYLASEEREKREKNKKKKMMWIISFMGERHGSIIVCMLCTQVASLQRSTLHISNWKKHVFVFVF